MADRLSQFPLLNASYNPSLLQQQQIGQSQQQSQLDSQTVPGFPNPENGRIWQQMQAQLASQSRFQNGGELSSAQVNQQMADILRSRAHMNSQQQFGLSANSLGASSQPSAQSNTTHMSPNFANLSMSQPQNRNPVGMYQNQNRHLELMGLSNQQTTAANLSAQIAARQQQLQNGMNMGQAQPNLFPSAAMSSDAMHNAGLLQAQQSGLVGNQQPTAMINGQPVPTGRRPMTFVELGDRAKQIQASVSRIESMLQELVNPNRPREPGFEMKLQTLTNERNKGKESLQKILHHMATINPANGLPNQRPGPNNDGQPPNLWQLQNTASQLGFASGPSGMGQPNTQNVQPGAPLANSHPSHVLGNNPLAQRNAQPPHQLLPGQLPNRMSPNASQIQYQLSNGPAQNMAQAASSSFQFPPPLEKPRFDSAYMSFCNTKGVTHDARLMSVDSRPIDLHALHFQVMSEGGVEKVSQKELWAVIGARMGFVQFPGTDSEPAKSGPGVAQHLAHVYKQYLAAFDSVYIQTVMDSKRKMQEAAQAQAIAANTASGSQNWNRAMAAHTMQNMVAYSVLSVPELRAKGLSDKIIQFIEANRAKLQQTYHQQNAFRGMIKQPNVTTSGGQPSQTGGPPNASAPFANPMQQLQNGTMAGGLAQNVNRPPQFNQQLNNMDSQFRPPPNQQVPGANGPQHGVPRPSQEQMMQAYHLAARMKNEYVQRNVMPTPTAAVREDQRIEYNATLENLHRMVNDIDSRLGLYLYVLKREDIMTGLISTVVNVQRQRSLLSSANPKFILDLNTLREMSQQISAVVNQFQQFLQGNQGLAQGQGNGQPPPNQSIAGASVIQRPSVPPSQASPQVAGHAQPPPQLVQRPPSAMTQPPLIKKKAPLNQPGPNGMNSAASPTPPPVASASTPAANAPTPTHTAPSPQTPKSPKNKQAAKPKPPIQAKRKVSVKANPQTPEATGGPPTPGSSTKRPREEDSSVTEQPPDQSPKRIKTEWNEPPSDELQKRQEQADAVKTDEEASAFYERMSELIKMAAAGDVQDSITTEVSETLGAILKGYSSIPDAPDAPNSSLISLGLGDVGLRDPKSPRATDEFVEFFDFSSFAGIDDDDNNSKAPTPDLVSSSSTNPSPGSETEAASHLNGVDIKLEDPLEDPLRLGPWKEIDGGESIYYQSSDWKWDGQMNTLDQPWAISNTS